MRTISVKNNQKREFRGVKALLVAVVLLAVGSLAWDLYDLNFRPEIAGTGVEEPTVSGSNTETCDPNDINNEDLVTSFSADKKWLLKGNEFSSQEKSVTFTITLNEKYLAFVPENNWSGKYAVVGTNVTGDFSRNGNALSAILRSDSLNVGEYQVVATVDYGCGSTMTDEYTLFVSYPVYVTWTQDWEGTDVEEQYLNDLVEISDKHGISMTHFFNPRIYVTDAVSEARADYLTKWVIDRTEFAGDDIGLHLHMFPDMVRAAGVEVNPNAPAWGQNRNDGYDITVSGYSEDDLVRVINWSKNVFIQNDLGEPVMFRAGGWFADMETLRALERTGFVMDSSGRTKYTLGYNNLPGYWDLSSTTNPYRPNVNDQNSAAGPNMDLWEFPNNGADSTNHKYDEMISRFKDNYYGAPVSEKRLVTFLSHPHWFYIDKPEIEKLFTEIDKNLYGSDNGPVIYTTLSESYRIWTLPNE